MKRFANLRESTNDTKNIVFNKTVSRVKVIIRKVGSKFDLFLDGDKLDRYNSLGDAEKSATTFIAQYKSAQSKGTN